MPADVQINRLGSSDRFVFTNSYPNEPNANSVDTITVSSDGKYINKELVKQRSTLPNGVIEIVTEEIGTDGNDNKPATFRHTYTFGKTLVKKIKDVQFAGDSSRIKRHEYSYQKPLKNELKQ